MDAIDAELKANSANNQSRMDKLKNAREKLCEKLATDLSALESGALKDGWPRRYPGPDFRYVELRWKVDGVPPNKLRAEAKEWMKSLGLEWADDAPSLRANVEGALQFEDPSLPEHVSASQN